MLSLVAQGRSNTAVASAFTISPRVVEKHVASIFAKLGLAPPGTTTAGSWPRSNTWNPDQGPRRRTHAAAGSRPASGGPPKRQPAAQRAAVRYAHESAGLSGDRRRRSVRKVTSGSAATPPDGQPVTPVRAQTLPLQGAANRVVRGLLRTPLLCRAVGGRLVTLYIVGRKSGRRYTVPVAYTRHDGTLLIGTPFGWGRNLRTGEPVDIRLKGRRRRPMSGSSPTRSASPSFTPSWRATTTASPSSTRSAWTRTVTRTRTTSTWPGPRAPGPSS